MQKVFVLCMSILFFMTSMSCRSSTSSELEGKLFEAMNPDWVSGVRISDFIDQKCSYGKTGWTLKLYNNSDVKLKARNLGGDCGLPSIVTIKQKPKTPAPPIKLLHQGAPTYSANDSPDKFLKKIDWCTLNNYTPKEGESSSKACSSYIDIQKKANNLTTEFLRFLNNQNNDGWYIFAPITHAVNGGDLQVIDDDNWVNSDFSNVKEELSTKGDTHELTIIYMKKMKGYLFPTIVTYEYEVK